MRLFAYIATIAVPAALLAAVPLASPAIAASAAATEPAETTAPKIETLDTLFHDLRHERDPRAAKQISDRIWARWRDSGSATVNLLMQWADKAIAEKKYPLALDFLDQVTVLLPKYPEGWNRRATLNFMMGNHAKSMADINRVLALEPRHYGALAGLAAILDARGNDQLALRAWEQMLEIYPANREAQKKVGELADKLAGSRT